MKRAPKKPLLKPFPEEQRPPVGQTPSSERLKVTGGAAGGGGASGDRCSSRQTWTEGNNATAVLFTICTFSWNTDKKFCRRRRGEKKKHKNKNVQKQMKETEVYEEEAGQGEVFLVFSWDVVVLVWSGPLVQVRRGSGGGAEASLFVFFNDRHGGAATPHAQDRQHHRFQFLTFAVLL